VCGYPGVEEEEEEEQGLFKDNAMNWRRRRRKVYSRLTQWTRRGKRRKVYSKLKEEESLFRG